MDSPKDDSDDSSNSADDTSNEADNTEDAIKLATDFETAFAHKETIKTIKIKKTTNTTIPDEVATMNILTNLTVTMTDLTVINPKIYEISTLKTLNLATNNITEIPAGISKLKNLSKLYMANNPIEDFPDELMTMTSLKSIMISNTKIPEARLEELRSALPNCDVKFSDPTGSGIAWEKPTQIVRFLGKNSQGAHLNFAAVQFFDANNAIAVGNSDWNISRTSDGGKTWTTVERADFNYGPWGLFSDIHFLNPNQGWLSGKNGIFYTTDGGKTLVQQYDQAAYSLHFYDDKRGVAQGEVNMLYTTDGGETWQTLIKREQYFSYSEGHFLTENKIIVAGIYGKQACIYQVDLSGDEPKIDSTYNDLVKPQWKKRIAEKIVFTDAENGFIFGTKGLLLKTTDGGATWTAYEDNKFNKINILDAGFLDANNGWAVGYNWETNEAVILRTTNGGKTWFNKIGNDVKVKGLDGVQVVDENHIYYIGEGLHKRI